MNYILFWSYFCTFGFEFSNTNFWEFFKISGLRTTLPGLYTPWTLPKLAAIVNLSLILPSLSNVWATSFGWVYKSALSTFVLSTPSYSPPVTPSSISKAMSNLLRVLRYSSQVLKFSSKLSTLKSSMWEVKSGFLKSLIFSLLAFNQRINSRKKFSSSMISMQNHRNAIMFC